MADRSVEDSGTRDGTGAIVAVISREVVGIYAEYYGRGPTKAKTTWRDDLVVCVLEDVFSRAERVLVDGGRFEQVRANRQAFQEQIEPILREAIEKVTDRRVETCLGQVSQNGVAVEVFILRPHLGASA
ncbi:MAG TPA: Na-translocating system protein MpsC family protein [Solirubrobacterales bacterium]